MGVMRCDRSSLGWKKSSSRYLSEKTLAKSIAHCPSPKKKYWALNQNVLKIYFSKHTFSLICAFQLITAALPRALSLLVGKARRAKM